MQPSSFENCTMNERQPDLYGSTEKISTATTFYRIKIYSAACHLTFAHTTSSSFSRQINAYEYFGN